MRVLIANVGERDIYYNIGSDEEPDFCHFQLRSDPGRRLANQLGCAPGARTIAEHLLERLTADPVSQLPRFRFPILEPVLHESEPDRLILVGTDQQDERYRPQDTIYSARLLAQLVATQGKPGRLAIVVVPYQGNPTDENVAYGIFQSICANHAPEPDVELCFAEITGGMPALTLALEQRVLNAYRGKARLFTVVPPQGEKSHRLGVAGAAQPVGLRTYLRDLVANEARALVDRYDFAGALAVLSPFSSMRFYSEDVAHALRHAALRVDLNYVAAAQEIESYRAIPEFAAWHRATSAPTLFQSLVDAAALARSRYRTGEFVEVLWRLIAFYENALRVLIQRLLPDLGIERLDTLGSENIAPFTGLKAKLRHPIYSDKQTKRQVWNITSETLTRICDYALETNDTTNAVYTDVLDLIKHERVNELRRWRNKVIHRLQPVSATILNAEFRTVGPPDASEEAPVLTYMDNVLRQLAELMVPRPAMDDHFGQVARYVLGQLTDAPPVSNRSLIP